MRGVDPNAVVAFTSVVAEKSFRGAARALGVSKSTLSERVALLEQHLGVRLLSRTTRSVALTDIGAHYHRQVAPAIAALSAAEGLIADLAHHPSGRLRMTLPTEIGHDALGDVLGEFAARYPDVKVEVDLIDRQVKLVDEGYDLAVRVGPLADSSLMTRRLGKPQQLGIYASPVYLERAGIPMRPRDLVQHRCLVMSGAATSNVWTFRSGRRATTVAIEPYLSVNSFRVLATLAARDLGIARMPSRYAHAEASLAEILTTHAPPPRQLFAVYPSARHLSSALRAMLDVLSERFELAIWAQPR